MPPPSNRRDDDISPLPGTFAKKPTVTKVNDIEHSFLTGAPLPKQSKSGHKSGHKSGQSKKPVHGGDRLESASKRSRHVAPSERKEDEDDDVESCAASDASFTEGSDASGSEAENDPVEEHFDKPAPKARARQPRPPAKAASEIELVPGFIYSLGLNVKNQLSVSFRVPSGMMTCGDKKHQVLIGKEEAGLMVRYTDDQGNPQVTFARVVCKGRSVFYVGKP